MNSFGRNFKIAIFGESHGTGLGILIDGCPAGLELSPEDFTADLERRKAGAPGTTPRVEEDLPNIKSGLFNGKTTGAPLAVFFENKNTQSGAYQAQQNIPRPGHADLTAAQKFGGFQDYRGGGHFSARLTAALVAAGVVAKKALTLSAHTITIKAAVTELGGEKDINSGLARAQKAQDSVGGIVECTVTGLPAGLGEPFFDSLESLLAHAIFAIPAVKGIEFGAGFASAKMFGSENNDPIENASGKTLGNNSGGINGGLSNSNPLVFRAAFKPAPSTPKEQHSLNTSTGKMESFSVAGRHDLCIALRAPVIVEAATAIVLTDLMLLEQKLPRILSK